MTNCSFFKVFAAALAGLTCTSLAGPIGSAVKTVRPFSGDKPQVKLEKTAIPDELLVSSSKDIRVQGARRFPYGSPKSPAHSGKVIIWSQTQASGTMSVKKVRGNEVYFYPVIESGDFLETVKCDLKMAEYVWNVTEKGGRTIMAVREKDGKPVGQVELPTEKVTGVGLAFTLRYEVGGIDVTVKGD